MTRGPRARTVGGRFRAVVKWTMVLLPGFLSACNSDTHVTQIQQLQDEVAQQKRELEGKDAALRQQAEQIRELMAISKQMRMDWIAHTERLDFASLSGGYDNNRDSIDDGVVVYLQPVDQDGHVVKAAGSVAIRLIDLASPPDQQEVGRLDLDVLALRKAWYGTLAYHYTLRVPWREGLVRPPHATITVDVRFTEYLTGKTFQRQTPFTVRGAAE